VDLGDFSVLQNSFRAHLDRFSTRTAPRILRLFRRTPALLGVDGLFQAVCGRIKQHRLVDRENCVEVRVPSCTTNQPRLPV
jgi:hypothetical protein